MTEIDIASAVSKLIATLAHKAPSPNNRLNWIYVLSAFAMSLYAYWMCLRNGENRSLREYLFPRSVWLHSSAITDYRFVAVMLPVWTLLIAPNLLSATRVSQNVLSTLQSWFGPIERSTMPTVAMGVLYTVVLIAVSDFVRYWVHRWMHRIPGLWEFHKVHHSAEVLTPISFFRAHPVDMLLPEIAEVLLTGLVTAMFLRIFPNGLTLVTILGVNAFRFFYYLFGANLRHSHIWFSFGSAVEHLIISPAQHQIHHSADPRHHNRNFGEQLAVWDWIFGTLYVPKGRETLTLGLGAEENRRLSSAWQLFLNPFRALPRHVIPPARSSSTSASRL
jgi:sterol desaturase/sphingolipid hydroxylase (fatty acid hydroxylase superfamily)